MERVTPTFEGAPAPTTPVIDKDQGFIGGYLKKRRKYDETHRLVPQPETVQVGLESTIEQSNHQPEASELGVMHRFRTLGERTLALVFETRDRLIEPDGIQVPEVGRLDAAADDMGEALVTLDEAVHPADNDRSIEAPIETPTAKTPRVQGVSQSEGAGRVETEQAPQTEWTKNVKTAARRVSDEMSNRFEQFNRQPKRAASTAELGVVAVLLGGALGMLFLAERPSAKKERAASKKHHQLTNKLEAKLEHQAEIIEHQEHQLEQLRVHEAPVRQVRKEAREVATLAHKQADTIREVAHVQDKNNASLLQKDIEHTQANMSERPPLMPGARIEPEKPGIIERLKPLIGIESIEQTSKTSSKADTSSASSGLASRHASHKNAKTSQKILGHQLALAKTKIDDAADSPFAWLYGLIMLATVFTIVAVLWVLTR